MKNIIVLIVFMILGVIMFGLPEGISERSEKLIGETTCYYHLGTKRQFCEQKITYYNGGHHE